jgi:hypothetical protein
MSHTRPQFAFALLIFLLLLAMGLEAQRTISFPDSGLFTTYQVNSPPTDISWVTCGSTQQSEGCYSSGNLGPFNQACAIVVGSPSLIGPNTVLRYIYVLDTGTTPNSVSLVVFRRTDIVTLSYDYGSTTQVALVPLPTQAGGTGVSCAMAANMGYIFLGTSQSPTAIRVSKSDLSVTEIGGFSPPINVSAVTSDAYGYVTVTFGNGFETGFYLYGPNGMLQEDGGGGPFLLNTFNSVLLSTVPQGYLLPRQLTFRRKTDNTDEK